MSKIAEGYKQTEVGVIPRDWEVNKLADIADIDPENLTNATNPGYSFNYISIEDVDQGILRNKTEMLFRNSPSRARRRVRKDDVIISTVRPNLKSHLLIKDEVNDLVCSTGFSVIRCKKDIADSGFVFNHFFSWIINKQIENLISGSNYPAINSKDVRSLIIPLPPTKAEQTAIATILNDADALITQLEKLIAKKRSIKQGAMQKLLNPYEENDEERMVKGELKMVNEKGNSQFTTRHLQLKKGWEVKRLGEIARLKKGQLITEKTAVIGNVPVIGGGMSISYYHNKPNRKPNTVTVSASGANAGYVSFHAYPIFASDCTAVEESTEYDVRFLYFTLLCKQKEIFKLQTGGAQPHVYPEHLRDLEISISNKKEEQSKVVQILSDMDAEIEALEKKLDKYKMLKQGMMQNLLTGKVRLIQRNPGINT